MGSIFTPAGLLAPRYQLVHTDSQPAYLLVTVNSLLHRLVYYGISNDDSLFLARPIFLLLRYQIEALSVGAFVPCLRWVHYLLPPRAESKTLLREDRERCVSGM